MIDTPGGADRPFRRLQDRPDARWWASPSTPSSGPRSASGGVRALVCDSTNVFVAAIPAAPRRRWRRRARARSLREAKGMVVATTFASNVARLKTLAKAAAAGGRSVCLLGRAMRRMVAGRGRDRAPHRLPRDRQRPRRRAQIPREQPPAARHRLAGRAARGVGAAQPRALPGARRSRRGTRSSSRPGPSPATSARAAAHERALREGRGSWSTTRAAATTSRATPTGPTSRRCTTLVEPQMVLIPMHGEHRHLRAHAKLGEAKGSERRSSPRTA